MRLWDRSLSSGRVAGSLPVDMSPSASGPFTPSNLTTMSQASNSNEALEIEMAASWLCSQITDSPTEDEDDDDEFDPLAPSPTPTPPPQPVVSDQPADAPASQQSVVVLVLNTKVRSWLSIIEQKLLNIYTGFNTVVKNQESFISIDHTKTI